MANINVDKFLRNGKAMFLAYDHGFEHGPTDFNEDTVDPQKVLDIALKSDVYTAIIFHEGIAQGYYPIGGVDAKNYPPLLLKLNGKTAFHKDEEPYSPQLCTVDEAVRIGASAVGYTIYVGSEHETKMMQEFSQIEDEAHAKGLAVTAWMYPRGKHVEGKETTKETIAYAARLGEELGADFIKIPYTGDPESFSWVVKSAGKSKILVSGGVKKDEGEFLKDVADFMSVGTTGIAVGRNVWQSTDPLGISKKLADIIYGKQN
jgi:class I fructose-bisphosphate aldolase